MSIVKFQAAMIEEQGTKFAIVAVQWPVLADKASIEKIITAVSPAFPAIPIILMAINTQGVPIFYGRQDIVNFLTQIPVDRIPWKVFEAPDHLPEDSVVKEKPKNKKASSEEKGNTILHS